MTTAWRDLVAAEPDLAEVAQQLLDAHTHKTMATLRRDGSPRISGIEAQFKDGELWLGMMLGSLKARDLLRDPRVALHSGSAAPDQSDPGSWPGDAKVTGRAVEVTDPAVVAQFAEGAPSDEMHLFTIDIAEVVVTRVGDPADHLVIDFWTVGGGRSIARRD